MRFVNRLMLSVAFSTGCLIAVADEPKQAVPAIPTIPAKKTDDKKKEEKKKEEKKLTEEEQAELEYKKYLELEQKRMAEMGKSASHAVSTEIKVLGTDKKSQLQTLTIDGSNRVLALVAPPRSFGGTVKNGFGEVHIFNHEGKAEGVWKVNFHAHAINVAPDGTVYVAGDGKVAAFDKDGKPKGETREMPHITELFKDKDTLRKNAEETLKKEKEQMAESLKQARKQFEAQIKKIEDVKEEERTKAQKRQLEQAKSILKSYDEMEKQDRGRTVDQVIESMTSRVRTINGIAVSEKDIFIACGETAGWGYAIWRFDRDMTNPKQILKDVGGCCGQMDVQVSGNDVIVAENTKHQFAKYDRDGKKIGGYGKRGADTDPACFGSCCNPMNTRAVGSDVYTAESEGVVKRFNSTGAFVGVTGTIKITGGCKNVAIGVSNDGERIYFCDQPGSKIHVLTRKTDVKDDSKNEPKNDKK